MKKNVSSLREKKMGTERMLAFSDGVFAIAITLLVLDIKLPSTSEIKTATDLINALIDIIPQFLAYIFSFLIIGHYWLLHHRMFFYIKRSNRRLLLINLYFLLLVSFVPFPTALLSEHGNLQPALILYASSLILARLVATWMWWYATYRHRLVDKTLDQRIINFLTAQSLNAAAIFLISIPISFISLTAAYWFWALIWLTGLVLNRVFRHEEIEDDEEEFGNTATAKAQTG
jgi:uncharacterized membrane protein